MYAKLLLLLTAASACVPIPIPIRTTVRCARSGRVIDARSGRPVSGAAVIVESWQIPAPPGYSLDRDLLHVYETKTEADGRWHVPAEKDWKVAILAADGFPVFVDSFCIVALGYEFFLVNPWHAEDEGRELRIHELLETRIP